VTTPPALTTAIAALLLLHMPPVKPSVRVMAALWQTEELPDIVPADGGAFTVIVMKTVVAPQPAVTV